MKLSVWILNFPTLTKRGVDLKVLSGKLVKIVRGNLGGDDFPVMAASGAGTWINYHIAMMGLKPLSKDL